MHRGGDALHRVAVSGRDERPQVGSDRDLGWHTGGRVAHPVRTPSTNSCPPGTKLATASWVASCYNPTDGQSYLIAYRDCCGANVSGRCPCFNTEGELPVYRPEFGNDIIWCFGAEDDAMTYHCTISPIVGRAG